MASQQEACHNALFSLAGLGMESFLPEVVGQACTLLEQRSILEVTEEKLEIMHTPLGQLWHRGMMQE